MGLRGLAVRELGVTMPASRGAPRLQRRVGSVIAAQAAVAAAFAVLVHARGASIGAPWIVAVLAAAFAVTGTFDMPLELHRHRFTFTLAEAVLAVGFFVVGPVGLALAAALGEATNMVIQRHTPLKVLFNVSNRLAAVTVAGAAFSVLGRTDVHDASAWLAALVATLCFCVIDIASTATVVSFAEGVRFHDVVVRSAWTGILAALAAAPVGLIALDLVTHGPFAPLLLLPVALVIAFNSRYAIAQRDEHLRFERLYEASARTAGLVALEDALSGLAAEARALGTGVAAFCCATDVNGNWVGARVDDEGRRPAAPHEVETAVAVTGAASGREVDVSDMPDLGALHADATSGIAILTTHERAGQVALLVLRTGTTANGKANAKNRTDTLAAFATNAALIVSNALLHQEREIALAREVDLNRQKSDFVAAVSHELRTPLAVMLGSVQTLERLDGRITPAQRTHLFEMSVEQGARLQRLIDELLLVAAAEHSNVQVAQEPVVLVELLESIEADTAAPTAGRFSWHVDPAEPVDEVLTDRSKLERILLNLVENAAKYAPEGPIELHASRAQGDAGESASLSVVDHGPGIPEADRERVFERFVQLDQSSTRRQGGTGLGLHLCRQLTELIGGRLVLTETPGGGCTFTLTIPKAPKASDERRAPQMPPIRARGAVA